MKALNLQRQWRQPLSAAVAAMALVAVALSSLSLLQGGESPFSSHQQKKRAKRELSLQSRQLLANLESDPKTVTDKNPSHSVPEELQSLDFPSPSSVVEHDLNLPTHDETGHFQPLQQQPNKGHQHQHTLQPYTILNMFAAYPAFRRELFILWYDYETDRFLIFVDEAKDKWIDPVRNRISVIAAPLTTALRHHFSDRFPEWVPRHFEEGEERMAWIREFKLKKKRKKIELEREHERREIERERKKRLGDAYVGDFVEEDVVEDEEESRARVQDFALLFSSGDVPEIDDVCIPHESVLADPLSGPSNLCALNEVAPILHFGSVFRDERILPSSVTMPNWKHTKCITQWQWHGTICSDFLPVLSHQMDVELEQNTKRGDSGLTGLVFGPEMGLPDYNDLVPQLIWRGTNFGFLRSLYPRVRSVNWDFDIQPRMEEFGNNARGVLAALVDIWNVILTPRWKGVVLSAAAELDVQEKMEELANKQEEPLDKKEEQENQPGRSRFLRFLAENDVAEPEPMSTAGYELMPWIDAKFVIKTEVFGEPVDDDRIEKYLPFQEHGISVLADYMPPEEMAQYKYQVDFGGAGGTAKMISKLAMPGLLFHHVTPTKDYFHDDLEPWTHYVPVATDLSDLRQKFHWAESNPSEARAIAEKGTEFARQMGTPEAYNEMYKRYFVENLGRVVDAYRPLGTTGAGKGVPKKWRSLTVANTHPGMNKMTLVATCTGFHEKCTFVGKKSRSWSE